jgi:hypothetical protein
MRLGEGGMLAATRLPDAAMNHEAEEVVKAATGASLAIEQGDWVAAQQMLTEAQDRIARLMREVGNKTRQAMMVPQPDRGDRG